MSESNSTITDIRGIRVGHATDKDALTGCTVVICDKGAVGGVDQRGGAPGTRETDLLRPLHLVQKVHAIVLAGGSAFGLDAAGGVMQYLEENSIGFDTGVAKVPIVPCAILFDLAIGNASIRPNAEMGYQACLNASTEPLEQGNVGAGTGATIGKILGMGQAMKSGIGTSIIDISGGLKVGAIVAVNAFGDVIDPNNGTILVGARTVQKGPVKIGKEKVYANTLEIMKTTIGRTALHLASNQNTVIGVIVTNAVLTKEETNKVAQMAQDGLARAIRPTHTMLDGDTLFVMATGKKKADVNIIGSYAAEATTSAIVNSIKFATPAAGLPSYSSINDY
ncbi:MAG TPA: P1 family peptidase [Anaerolineae bacterium]|nr:P1 family peptidase [Anaerolineae bacterium]